VLFAVGLRGEGEIGVRGTILGDLSDREGRPELCPAAEMLRESLGLAARAAYMIDQVF